MTFFSTQTKLNSSDKIDIHSHKFIRLARSAKLANLSFLKDFTFFKEFGGSETTLSNEKNLSFNVLPKSNLLLFLNQGLSAKELTKLRFNLKSLGITFTHIPTRFWSNSFVHSDNKINSLKSSLSHYINHTTKTSKIQKPFKKSIYGNILGFYVSPSSRNITASSSFLSDPIYLIYQFIQNNIIQENQLKPYIVQNKDLLSFISYDKDINNFVGFSRLTLPWDLLASQMIEEKSHDKDVVSFMLNSWFQESQDDSFLNHINLLFTYLKNNRLTYAGLLNTKNINNSSLFFDNIDLIHKSPFSKKTNFNMYKNNTFFCFEPFLFSCFTKQHLLYI